MKILELKISTPSGEEVRDITFAEVGISFIYGDIKRPQDLGGTINSLGKTLLLKCIDYILGANEDKTIIKDVLWNYVIEAVVLYKGEKYGIKRILGTSEEIFIDDKGYSLNGYKDFFKIDRGIYSKQLLLKKKSSELSFRNHPDKNDIVNCLKLLNIETIIDNIENIYHSQDKIAEYKGNKKELVAFYGKIDVAQIDEEIYFVDKEVKRLTCQLDVISDKIKNIEVSEIQKNVVEEYEYKSKQLKEISSEYEQKKLECVRLDEFIDKSNKIDISSEHIMVIFEKAKLEVPDMVKRSLGEVEEFHKKVYDERKEFLNEKIASIEQELNGIETEIEALSLDIDKIGKVISTNQIYQESISLYEKYNNDLQDLKFKEGKLSQIKNVDTNINIEDGKLVSNFDEASRRIQEFVDVIKEYRDFIYDITKNIYDDDVNSYFDIKIRKKHLKTRPVEFEFTLRGDTGEGVNEVKKNLIDLLLCKYNKQLDILVMDSACFNGIDPRQVSGILVELKKIAYEVGKQIVVSVNKYQIGDNQETNTFVKDNSVLILSEKDKLFRMDF